MEMRGRAQRRDRAKSVRRAHHAVAEALRLHLAHMTSPLTFDSLLADHRAALLFERLALVLWMGLLRGVGRGRQREQETSSTIILISVSELAVNGLTAWLGVASGRAKAVGGGA